VKARKTGAKSLAGRAVARALDLATLKRGWKVMRPGVDIRHLAGGKVEGPTAALLRYAPGARVPKHRHAGFEVIYVLDGAQSDERGSYPAGTLIVNPVGGSHSVWSDDGCLVLIVWERSIEFL
jgi:anti-sigma factor ChrR (cupin superfamily)